MYRSTVVGAEFKEGIAVYEICYEAASDKFCFRFFALSRFIFNLNIADYTECGDSHDFLIITGNCMEGIVLTVNLTCKCEGLALDIFESCNSTGTVCKECKTGIIVITCIEVRKNLYTCKFIVCGVVSNTVCGNRNKYSVFIKCILDCKSEKCGSCRCIYIVDKLIVIRHLFGSVACVIFDITRKHFKFSV